MKNRWIWIVLALIALLLYLYSCSPLDSKSGQPDLLDLTLEVNESELSDATTICPCPEDYPEGSTPYWTRSYDCDYLDQMLEWKASLDMDGYVTYGPYRSPVGWTCDYYMWVCQR